LRYVAISLAADFSDHGFLEIRNRRRRSVIQKAEDLMNEKLSVLEINKNAQGKKFARRR
jgi:hypothetical protein